MRFLPSALILGLILCLFCGFSFPKVAQADILPENLAKVVQEIEYLDQMRSGLASTLEGRSEEPTPQTMQEVCKPVGMRAKQLSQENGWQVKQMASKYRNREHKPDSPQAVQALNRFSEDPELLAFWQKDTVKGQEGMHYFRRINVEASCLACHGAKENRPKFVQEKYPQDLAFDFQVGDLRGMYSVFVPEVQQALQQALTE
ncbi:Tll0287-like domain-containing protein [Spirulina subsalsa]|uniref:Tll0287-like domain-containing protein n=1 Tax=Spirulina subsalsa TaxID=54311 RepID=UPI0003113707|nr:DUF3365 domain-containing protein [Spirulina subsalsa]